MWHLPRTVRAEPSALRLRQKILREHKAALLPLDDLDLAYVHDRAAPGRHRDAPTLVILPGGPGLASIRPYRRTRQLARREGFSPLMIDHRGVGCSRFANSCSDPDTARLVQPEQISVAAAARDVVAVLDHLRIPSAWILGTSYGGFVAQQLAMTAGDRVLGLTLDSTYSFAAFDALARQHLRETLMGELVVDAATDRVRQQLRHFMTQYPERSTQLVEIARPCYEVFGPELLALLLRRASRGGFLEWNALRRLWTRELTGGHPFVFEPDLVARMHVTELRTISPDGLPLDEAPLFDADSRRYASEPLQPFDFRSDLARIRCSVLLLHGERDLRVPGNLARPPLLDAIPSAAHVTLRNFGHSITDWSPSVAIRLTAAHRAGHHSSVAKAAEHTPHPLGPLLPLLRAFLARPC